MSIRMQILGLLLVSLGERLSGSGLESVGSWLGLPFVQPQFVGEGASFTIGDSDEDKVVQLYRGWYVEEAEGWVRGWEIGIGMVDSGKESAFGAFGSIDKVLRRRLASTSQVALGFHGALGWQVQTTGFPGDSLHNFRIAAAFDWRRAPDAPRFLRLGYFHLSNANVGGGNEGIDAVWIGTGRDW